jgi:2Fe-2S ferredoxin
MPAVVYLSHDGERFEVEADAGSNLMQAAVDAGIAGILGECGGACACATCHVHVAPEWADALPEAETLEKEMLFGAIDPDEYSRLGCQITVTEELDGLTVTMPEMQI